MTNKCEKNWVWLTQFISKIVARKWEMLTAKSQASPCLRFNVVPLLTRPLPPRLCNMKNQIVDAFIDVR